jgi:hypothetical protein
LCFMFHSLHTLLVNVRTKRRLSVKSDSETPGALF